MSKAGDRLRNRRTHARLLTAVVAAAAVLAACTPELTPPPKPEPIQTGTNPDLSAQSGVAAYTGPGPYAAGVRTIEVEPGRKAEVWYPAEPTATVGMTPASYSVLESASDFLKLFVPAGTDVSFQTAGFRDVPVAPGGPFPLVLFSHGAMSYRLQSTFLTTHLASWGFVVVSPDYFERGLQSLLGIPPAPAHTDDYVAGLTYDAMVAANTAGPLAGTIDTTRLFPVGHSAGGSTSMRLAIFRPEVSSWISLAGGVRPTSQIVPPSLFDATKSSLWMGGAQDGVASPQSVQDAFDYSAGERKLVMIPGAGHNNAFSDICEIGREYGGLAGIAISNGLPVPSSVVALANDGCAVPPAVLSDQVWPITRHFVTAELRYRTGIDAEPIGLGLEVTDQFGAVTPDYAHNP